VVVSAVQLANALRLGLKAEVIRHTSMTGVPCGDRKSKVCTCREQTDHSISVQPN
jgi:hypothetical protein